MNLGETKEISLIALRQLASHKFRSFLTVLGVTIGVLAVIVIAAIIHGLNASVMDRVASLGSRSFFVSKHEMGAHMGRESAAIRQRKDLTMADVEALRRQARKVSAVSPFLTAQSLFGDKYVVKYRDERAENPLIRGVGPEFAETMGTVIVQEGRFFSEADDLRGLHVAVLGHSIASALFPVEDPIGREIRINGIPFTVIGTLEHQEGLFGGFSEDNYVLIPFGTFRRMWPEVKDIAIALAVEDPADLPAAMEETEFILRTQRKVPYNKPSDFTLFTSNMINDMWKQLTFALFVVTIVIASIGLMVGGIGVMNIMLVSVKERTREIGIRKAIGARRRDILFQFVVEAMTLTSTGGLAGVAVAGLITLVINLAVPALPASMSLFWTLLGIGVSASVGLVFGIWPALKAARLDPIECLRYE